jgi:glycosyltransferase involved in cell wall biosynthesis
MRKIPFFRIPKSSGIHQGSQKLFYCRAHGVLRLLFFPAFHTRMTSQRTVLIISYYFPPMGLSSVLRTAKTARFLCEYGWKPIILTATPRYYYAYDESLLDELLDSGAEIIRTPPRKPAQPGETRPLPGFMQRSILDPFRSLVYLPDTAIRWRKSALQAAAGILQEHKVNIILAIGPPFTDFLVAGQLAEEYQIPFILDYQDYWSRDPERFSPTPFHSSYHKNHEADLLKRTARAIVTSRAAKERMIREFRFLEHEDILIVPHGYDPDDVHKGQGIRPPSTRFIITHAGLFENSAGGHSFIRALALFFKENPQAAQHTELRLPGVIRPATSKLIEKLGLQNNIIRPGYIQHNQLFPYMAESHILLASTVSQNKIPGKLYEYSGLRRALCILAPKGSAAEKFGQESGAAFSAPPRDTKAQAAVLARMYKQWQEQTLPRPAQSFADQYSYRQTTAELSRALAIAARI